MSYLRQDTLAYHRSRPLVVAQSLRSLPLKSVVDAMNKYFKGKPGHASVEESALTFYLLNHAYACLGQKFGPHQPLGEFNEIAERYIQMSSAIAIRAMYYVLLICARESRHVHKTASFKTKMQKGYGEAFWEFQNGMPDDPAGAVDYFRHNAPPSMSFCAYTKALVYVFEKGAFGSSSYGGPLWAKVAGTLRAMAAGESSPEMFVDTVWALRHNTAPIFNKGMLFEHDKHELNMILDVQRAGLIPQLVGDSLKNGDDLAGVTSTVQALYSTCLNLMPTEFGGHVDWVTVKERGALHDYSIKINQQIKKYGVPPSLKVAAELEGKKYFVTEDEYAVAIDRKDIVKEAA